MSYLRPNKLKDKCRLLVFAPLFSFVWACDIAREMNDVAMSSYYSLAWRLNGLVSSRRRRCGEKVSQKDADKH